MAYFDGELEIMTIGWPHETAKDLIGNLVVIVADSLKLNFRGTGHHTFRHLGKKIGFEADLSYYVTNLARMRKRTEVNLETDPPPDLVVEVDVSRNSRRKLLMYAALGIPEVWRYEGGELRIYRLSKGEYTAASESLILGGLSANLLTTLLADGESMDRTDWFDHIRSSIAAR